MALLVNGEQIEDSAILKEAERLRPDYEKTFAQMNPEKREAQLLDWSKENIIERILLQQEVRSIEPETPHEHLEPILTNLKKNCKSTRELYEDFEVDGDEKLKHAVDLIIRTEKMFEKLLKNMPRPSNAAIRQYYEKNKDQFSTGEQIRAAHIVKYVDWQNDEEQAYQAIQQAHIELKNGATFEETADKYSDCKDQNGDLGNISRGQMAEEFDDIVFNLDAGQVSEIFRTRFGFHIAKVYSRYQATIHGLDHVKEQIEKKLYEQMRVNAIHEFIDQLKNKAQIEEISTNNSEQSKKQA